MDENNKYSSKYLDIPNTPLYPFGYGLSYTSFNYDDISLNKTQISASDKLEIQVTLTNTGMYDGEETTQLYIQDMFASVTRPLKELRGFHKAFVKKGETVKFTMTITIEDLKFYNKDMKWVYEPGDFKVYVGGNSRDTKAATFKLVK